MGKRGGRSGGERNVRRRGSPEQAVEEKGSSGRKEEPKPAAVLIPPSAAALILPSPAALMRPMPGTSIHLSSGALIPPSVAGHVPATMEDERGTLIVRLPKKDREVDTASGYRLRKEVKPSPSRSTASNSSAGGNTSDSSSSRSASSDKSYMLTARHKPGPPEACHTNPAAAQFTFQNPGAYQPARRKPPSTQFAPQSTASDSSARGNTSDSSSCRSASSDNSSLAATKPIHRKLTAPQHARHKPGPPEACHINPGAPQTTFQNPGAYQPARRKPASTQSAHNKPAAPCAHQKSADTSVHGKHLTQYHSGHGKLPADDPEIRLQAAFLDFLNRYVKGNSDSPHFPAMVHYMKVSNNFNVEIPFKEMLKFNPRLAIAIVNHRRPELALLPTVHNFLVSQGLATKREIELKTSLVFDGIFSSITLVEDYFSGGRGLLVKEFNNIFGEGHCAAVMANLTIALLGGFAVRIIDTWKHGLSWGGIFGPKDMAVVDKRHYIITKKPEVVLGGSKSQRARAKIADLHALEAVFTPVLDARKEAERVGPPDDSDLPLFYSQFRDALLGATEDEVDEEWFEDYVIHNPVLKPPEARHDIVCDSYLATYNSSTDVAKKVLSKHPCPGYNDWQKDIVDSDVEVLTEVYYHSVGGKPKEGKAAGGSGDGTSTSAIHHDLFPWEMKGVMKYDRHLLQHLHQIRKVRSIAEAEIFASKKLVPYLPNFLKLMLEEDLMKEEGFIGIWEDYKKSRIQTTDGSDIQPGPQLLLWELTLDLEGFPELRGHNS